MSIRNGLLALLLEGRAYGNQLRTDFEERTGGTWPLNIGQVYQTLDRLVRDGLVVAEDVRSVDIPVQARSLYRITDAGQAEVMRWFAEPVARGLAPRDELAIKLAVAMCSPRADVSRIIDVQRGATMGALQELTAVKRRQIAADPTRVTRALDAHPRSDDLRHRGRAALARPLRIHTASNSGNGDQGGPAMNGQTTAGSGAPVPVLELVGAWRTHGEGPSAVTALRAVSLTLREGELVAVMGPSGSGKSTLLNLAGGLDQPTQGDVRIGTDSTVGASAAHLAMLRRRHLGFVFQDANLVGSLTAGENVALPRELDGVPVRVARREAEAALAEVGLAGVGPVPRRPVRRAAAARRDRPGAGRWAAAHPGRRAHGRAGHRGRATRSCGSSGHAATLAPRHWW